MSKIAENEDKQKTFDKKKWQMRECLAQNAIWLL